MKINILGTQYNIKIGNESEYPKLKENYGYCDPTTKEIVVSNFKSEKENLNSVDNLEYFKAKVLRHEIIHAAFYESGLSECSDFANNEELVDWIALQFPKLQGIFAEAGV